MSENNIINLDPLYPSILRETAFSGASLFYKGKIEILNSSISIAIVGTRTPTPEGAKTAHDFAFFLAKKGITIVSGLAYGVDAIAHKAALEANGKTVAVLGSGLSSIYPREHESLADKISKTGVLISEYPDETIAKPKYFLARNRIVAGISKCVVVIEGRRRSGTLSTANYAASIGREVFAVPGRIGDPFSEAPNFLISEGAQIVLSPNDLL